MTLPRITIVTPAFRSAATIEATIRSIVAQDYPNFEYFAPHAAQINVLRDACEWASV